MTSIKLRIEKGSSALLLRSRCVADTCKSFLHNLPETELVSAVSCRAFWRLHSMKKLAASVLSRMSDSNVSISSDYASHQDPGSLPDNVGIVL